MNLSIKRVEANRNFANKLWNAGRFVVSAVQGAGELPAEQAQEVAARSSIPSPQAHWSLADRWIYARLRTLERDMDRLFQNYQYGEAGRQAYEFFWNDFADWYVEIAKLQMNQQGAAEHGLAKNTTIHLLAYVLDTCLRLLHPFTPFVTEEIWGHLKYALQDSPIPYRLVSDALMISAWPEAGTEEQWEQEAVEQFGLVQEIVRSIRNVRAEKNVKPGRRIPAIIGAGEQSAMLRSQAGSIASLAQLDERKLVIEGQIATDKAGNIALVVGGVEVYLPLAELVDRSEEKARLEKELRDAQRQAQRLEELLAGPFAQKAPPAVVQKERERLAIMADTVQKLEEQLKSVV
jgi:valyl-tRNA synthetase